MKPDGGPAFPRKGVQLAIPKELAKHPDIEQIAFFEDGMSLRDYFAAKAMQALVGRMTDADSCQKVAEASYTVADSMIAERTK